MDYFVAHMKLTRNKPIWKVSLYGGFNLTSQGTRMQRPAWICLCLCRRRVHCHNSFSSSSPAYLNASVRVDKLKLDIQCQPVRQRKRSTVHLILAHSMRACQAYCTVTRAKPTWLPLPSLSLFIYGLDKHRSQRFHSWHTPGLFVNS